MTSIIYDYPAIAKQLKGDGWYTPAKPEVKDLSPSPSFLTAMQRMYDLEQETARRLEYLR